MTDYQRWRDEFIARVTKQNHGGRIHGMTVMQAREMMLRATTAQRLAELLCTRELTPAETNRDEDNDAAATKLARWCGFGLHIQGDPRGPVFRLLPPGAREPESDGIPVPSRGYTAKQLDAMTRG